MKKRIILVTGGNRGIGLATVKGLSINKDDKILMGCRNLEEGEKASQELGGNISPVHVDLNDRDQLKSAVEKIIEEYGRIDVLINNAGVHHPGSFNEVSVEDYDQSMRVNTTAPFELIRAVLPSMEKNGYGRIVNVASGWGSFNEGLEGPFAYSVSKAAINAMTFHMAKTMPKNIKINSMCPGWVRTRMGGDAAPRTPEEGADTAIFLANLEADGPSGGFYRDRKPIKW
jgi:NAD(P)-dependent dehydrogenase (short-subunit alcohol dehydrogenase family)